MKRKYLVLGRPLWELSGVFMCPVCRVSSVHDQTGYPGEREHSGRGVASPCLHTHSQEEEVHERGIGARHTLRCPFLSLIKTCYS